MNFVEKLAQRAQEIALEKMEAERDEAVWRASRARNLAEAALHESEFAQQRTRQAKAEAEQAEHTAEMQRIALHLMKQKNQEWLDLPTINAKGSS